MNEKPNPSFERTSRIKPREVANAGCLNVIERASLA